jgi:hypothetical protein
MDEQMYEMHGTERFIPVIGQKKGQRRDEREKGLKSICWHLTIRRGQSLSMGEVSRDGQRIEGVITHRTVWKEMARANDQCAVIENTDDYGQKEQ